MRRLPVFLAVLFFCACSNDEPPKPVPPIQTLLGNQSKPGGESLPIDTSKIDSSASLLPIDTTKSLLTIAKEWAVDFFKGSDLTVDSDYDKTESSLVGPFRDKLPNLVDLSDRFPAVGDQKSQNSCTGWAAGYASRSYYVAKESGEVLTMSPSFIYNLLNQGKDKGVVLSKALQLLEDTGVCPLISMPYDEKNYTILPGPAQIAEAELYRIYTFRKVDVKQNAIGNLKAQLVNGDPVVCSVLYDLRYFSEGLDNQPRTKPFVWDTMEYKPKKQHAITIVGYDDKLKAFKFINSAGERWGNKGFGWIAYKLLQQNNPIRTAYLIIPMPTVKKALPNLGSTPDCDSPEDSCGTDLQSSNPRPGGLGTGMQGGVGGSEDTTTDTNHNLEVLKQTSTNEIMEVEYTELGFNFYIETVFTDSVSDRSALDKSNERIRVVGLVRLPAGLCSDILVAVRFYNDDISSKQPIKSRNNYYQLANGNAAASTNNTEIESSKQFEGFWVCDIPFKALELRKKDLKKFMESGTPIKLLAEPIIYSSGFPPRLGNKIPFEIK